MSGEMCAEHNSVCVGQARTEEQVRGLKDDIKELNECVKATNRKVDDGFEKVQTEISKIYSKLSKRPSWLTSGLITILTSLLLALIVYVLTGGTG